MQAPRCICYTAVTLSLASQLLQGFVVFFGSALVYQIACCIRLHHRPIVPQCHQYK